MKLEIPLLVSLVGLGGLALSMVWGGGLQGKAEVRPAEKLEPGEQHLILGGGCFWCYEGMFEILKGVRTVEVGYAGGARPNPTYEQVCSGVTGHAEVFRVIYDPKLISADDLLRIFFTVHDPTTLNRQGSDVGTQYRSVIFYESPKEKERAERIIAEITREKIWKDPIVTTLEPLKNYSRAEEYHQDYFEKYSKASEAERMGMNGGYCKAIISPKVAKFRQKFAHLLK
ncbi:MAG TPA: peptide-methionine (S)-S-oxide reductase MsrA [Fimbriimonadaceae bacterium]|nr:peptide-methionine (S)-S-oxide reductase MsrA [Fimbriimonadaceae bacterium]